MIGQALLAGHRLVQAVTAPIRRRTATNPFAVIQGAFDALEQKATERRDMRAVHQIREARKVVTREALHP